MASTTCLTNTFRTGLLVANQDLSSNTLKLSMHNGVDLLQTTTQYSTSGEITGTGYSAGGATMGGATAGIDNSNHVAWYTFNDVTFSSSSLTADTVLLYNNSVSSPTNKPSIGVFYLGSAKTSSSGDFKIVMPTANFSSALVRLA